MSAKQIDVPWNIAFRQQFPVIFIGLYSDDQGNCPDNTNKLDSFITTIYDMHCMKYTNYVDKEQNNVSLECVNANQGGHYIVNLLDNHAAPISMLLIVSLETIAVNWFYGK